MHDKWTTRGQTTIPRALSEACSKWPDKVFLDFSGETYTYREVEGETMRIAHGLAALGVKAGDRVCAVLDNVSDFVFVWFGVNQLGAIFVPINTDMKGEFLRHQVADADAAILVVEAHYAERVFAIEHGIPEVHTLVVRGAVPDTATRLAVRSLDSIRPAESTPIAAPCKPGDLALLMYTSGTTGPSKGCMVSHNYACNFARSVIRMTTLNAEDVYGTPLPLFHAAAAFGVLIATLLTGATTSIYPRFSASNFWPEIERSRATVAFLLSVVITIVPDTPDTEVSKRCYGQLRTVSGAPWNAKLKAQWKERFGVKGVGSGYGMTETCLSAFSTAVDPDVPDGATGPSAEYFDVRIFDDQGEECAPGVAGEIVVRPRQPDLMFQGYWRRPEVTVDVMRDLWFHTGDLGKFDENGFLYFVDRKKDYLRRGGENISSFEVEATFLSHPDIAEAAVHAVKSEISEDEVKLTAVLKPGVALTEEALCRWSLDHLPRFAVPRFIEFRSHMVRTPSGRIQKFLLRDEGVTAATWDRKKSDIVLAKR